MPNFRPRLVRHRARARVFAALRLLVTLAGALATAPPALAAQQSGPAPPVRAVPGGPARDSSGAPVATAGVELDGDGQWRTVGPGGEFRFRGLAAGRHVLRVRALGFALVEGELSLGATDSIDVDVTLARAATTLDTVRSVTPVVPPYGPADFQERRQRGGGFYLTRDEFERQAPSRMSDLLVRIPGVERRPKSNRLGSIDYVLVMRGTSTVKGDVCPVNVYVDGRNFELGGEDIDRLIRPSEIEAIEVYTGGARIPARYSGPTARCGVLAFWTRATAR